MKKLNLDFLTMKAKKISGGEWVEGLPIIDGHNENNNIDRLIDSEGDFHLIDSDTLCRYVGHRGEGGVRIYSNDEIDYNGEKGEVCWSETCCNFCICKPGSDTIVKDWGLWWRDVENFKVTGNKFGGTLPKKELTVAKLEQLIEDFEKVTPEQYDKFYEEAFKKNPNYRKVLLKNMFLEYKGYTAAISLEKEKGKFFGHVEYIRDLITFDGDSYENLVKNFHDMIDEYIEDCKEVGKEPDTPTDNHTTLLMKGIEKSLNRQKKEINSSFNKNDNKSLDYYLNLKWTLEYSKGEDGFLVKIKELPGCITCGDNFVEATTMVTDALISWLKIALEGGVDIPEPNSEEI